MLERHQELLPSHFHVTLALNFQSASHVSLHATKFSSLTLFSCIVQRKHIPRLIERVTCLLSIIITRHHDGHAVWASLHVAHIEAQL